MHAAKRANRMYWHAKYAHHRAGSVALAYDNLRHDLTGGWLSYREELLQLSSQGQLEWRKSCFVHHKLDTGGPRTSAHHRGRHRHKRPATTRCDASATAGPPRVRAQDGQRQISASSRFSSLVSGSPSDARCSNWPQRSAGCLGATTTGGSTAATFRHEAGKRRVSRDQAAILPPWPLLRFACHASQNLVAKANCPPWSILRAAAQRTATAREIWWPRAELNHRHKDFQSSALPTELLGHELSIIAGAANAP